MASTLKSSPTFGIAQVATTIYTAAASPATTATIIGLLCSNTGSVIQHATVKLVRGGTGYSIITGGVVPTGNTLECTGNDKVVVMPGDSITAVCDAGTMDCIVSYLEQTP